MRIFELPTLTLSSPTATSWRRRALHLPSHLPVFLLALILLGLFTTHAFRLPSHVAGGTTSSINRAGSLLAPISSVASAGRRRGKALALFSGIVEQMGRVQKVEMDKDMVMWSGETGKGTLNRGREGGREGGRECSVRQAFKDRDPRDKRVVTLYTPYQRTRCVGSQLL